MSDTENAGGSGKWWKIVVNAPPATTVFNAIPRFLSQNWTYPLMPRLRGEPPCPWWQG